ncbi:Trigger factor [Propionispora sp. 2/2-37]|uniref:trigger factor n=1 Tax=Propionispora sp. 2/2-37 TaxID=1677858 RepID=UPI0006BB733F|nr:trigger factor [Propionispora sp. 2/2-37]CUH93957.1 Trigger factor [Propionispora sp. 2/2-37]
MKVTMETIDQHNVVLEMEVPQPEVSKALDKAYHKIANQVNIPGFRKGKIPRAMLEKRIGKQALLDEAFEILAPQYYLKALDEQKIEPVSRPKIDVVTLQEDQPLVFKATVTKKPEILLGEYKNLSIEQPAVEVTDEQVNNQLEALRSRHAKMVVVEDAEIANGDFAIIDFEGFIDDVPFKGGSGKAYPLEIGSGSFIPGFEEQLLGAKAGETRDVNVSFPEDYHVSDLAGKPAVFKVTIQDVKRKELPELDDEFAKDVSEFENLEELKTDIQNKLEKAAREKAENDFKNAAVKAAVDNASAEVPEVMIEDRIDNMVGELDINLQNRGMQLDKYLEYVKMDMDTLRQNYRESAAVNVKTDLLLEAVAKAEGLSVTKEEIDGEIAAMAQAYQATPKEVAKIIREQGRLDALAGSILRKKAANIIIDSAVKA